MNGDGVAGESKRAIVDGVTVSKKTADAYMKRYWSKVAAYCQERQELRLEPDPVDFAKWLIHERVTKRHSYSTWRQFRSSVLYAFDQRGLGSTDEELLQRLKDAELLLYGNAGSLGASDEPAVNGDSYASAAAIAATTGPRTSARKAKKLHPDDFEQIDAWLHKKGKNNKWALPLSVWLQANLLTGMRPSECANAVVVDDPSLGKLLKIKNAKATNGRANGEYRELVLSNMPPERLRVIDAHLDLARTMDKAGTFDEFHRACAHLMAKATKQLFPRRQLRPTLYSARHQFIADAKAEGFSKTEVAAMAGHGSADTATIHYARKAAGASLVWVRPTERSMVGIRAGREWTPNVRPGVTSPEASE